MKNYFTSNAFALIAALAITSPLFYWSMDRSDPVEIRSYRLVPQEVAPGQTVYRAVTVYRRKACHTDPTVVIVDSGRVHWRIDEAAVQTPGPSTVEDSYKIPVKIPLGIAIGPAEMRVTIARRCNPMHFFWPQITVYAPLKFTVIPT